MVNFVKKQTGYDINPRGLFTSRFVVEKYNEILTKERGFGLTKAERQNYQLCFRISKCHG